jgi:hypothetical protein
MIVNFDITATCVTGTLSSAEPPPDRLKRKRPTRERKPLHGSDATTMTGHASGVKHRPLLEALVYQLAECPSPCLTHCARNSSSCSSFLAAKLLSGTSSHSVTSLHCSQVRSASGTPGSRTHRDCCDCRTTPSRRTRPAPFLDARVRLRRSFHVGFSRPDRTEFSPCLVLRSVDTVSDPDSSAYCGAV